MSDVMADVAAPAAAEPIEATVDIRAAFRNIVAELQEEPQRYRLFGVYWWAIKALLKRAGYGRDQLYLLGDYQDGDGAARVPKLHLMPLLQAAFAEFGFNARTPHPASVVEDPDGELVFMFDEDAGL